MSRSLRSIRNETRREAVAMRRISDTLLNEKGGGLGYLAAVDAIPYMSDTLGYLAAVDAIPYMSDTTQGASTGDRAECQGVTSNNARAMAGGFHASVVKITTSRF